MVITQKISNGKYVIMIPDEGVKSEIDKINRKESFDTFDIGLLAQFIEMNNYYESVIRSITEYLTNNQKPNSYKLIDICYDIQNENYVQCYIIECNSYDAKLIGKKISNLINRKKENYRR